VVGALPKSAPAAPEAEVGPVLVIPDPARTTKLLVVPRRTRDSEAELPVERLVETATKKRTAAIEKATKCLVILNGFLSVFGMLKAIPLVVRCPPVVEWPPSRLHLRDIQGLPEINSVVN
jgi:hypothetical protein